MKPNRLLFLDDIRNPYNPNYQGMVKALLTDDMTEEVRDLEIHWVKSHSEFVEDVREHGLPTIVSFDHDLAEAHYDPRMYQGVHEYSKLYGTFVEPTGYDSAKWLVEYCIDNGLKLPEYNCHSQNPAGKGNILTYLRNYKRQEADVAKGTNP